LQKISANIGDIYNKSKYSLMKKLNIVFAGTPAFSVPSLAALYNSDHNIIAVYTQPDRPKGRGLKLHASEVKTWALEHNLPIYQPLNFKASQDLDILRTLKPDLVVVVAYGLILPQSFLDIPKFGCVNVHASILPRWRGAAPIQYALLHGDNETGVSIMQLDAGMDTGPVFCNANCSINLTDNAQILHDKLAVLGCAPLLTTVDAIAADTAIAVAQDHTKASYAHKIDKSLARIVWSEAADTIYNKIRALQAWPVAFTSIGDMVIKIYEAEMLTTPANTNYGSIISIDNSGIKVAVHGGVINIKTLQFPGGKVLAVKDWINAQHKLIKVGDILC
jgi:methionyl-tRNA formyltransferase